MRSGHQGSSPHALLMLWPCERQHFPCFPKLSWINTVLGNQCVYVCVCVCVCMFCSWSFLPCEVIHIYTQASSKVISQPCVMLHRAAYVWTANIFVSFSERLLVRWKWPKLHAWGRVFVNKYLIVVTELLEAMQELQYNKKQMYLVDMHMHTHTHLTHIFIQPSPP